MSRRDNIALARDMLEAAEFALAEIRGKRLEELIANRIWTLGLMKCLEIVGEAASRLDAGFRAHYPDIPWIQIVGMRNRLVHTYFEIDYEQVWRTLADDLPELVEHLRAMLAEQDR